MARKTAGLAGNSLTALGGGVLGQAAAVFGSVGTGAGKNLTAQLKKAATGLRSALAPATRQMSALRTGVAETAKALAVGQNSADAAAEAMNRLGTAAAEAAAGVAQARRQVAGFDELHLLPGAAESESGSSKKGSSGKKSSGKSTAVKIAAEGETALAALQAKLSDFWAGFKASLAPAAAAWAAAWQQIGATAQGVWPGVKAAALSLWSGGLLPLLQYLTGTFVPGVVNSFSAAFAPILSGVVSTGITVLANGFNWLCGLLQNVVNTLAVPALNLILTVWQGLMGGIAAAWATYGQPLMDGVVLAFGNLQTLLMTVYTTVIQPVVANIIALLGQLWQNSLQPLWNQLVALFASLCVTVLNFWNRVMAPLLNWLAATVGPVFTAAFNTAAAIVSAAVGLIADACSVLAAGLQGVLTFLNTLFVSGWNAAWQTVESSVSAVWGKITALVRNAVNGIIGIINGMAATAAAAVNAVLSGVNKISGGKLNLSVGTPSIPHLAAGGYVGAGRPTLAMIGDNATQGEIVAPEGKLAEAVAAGVAQALAALPGLGGNAGMAGGNDGTPINIYLGGELLDRVILSAQNRVALRSGGRA